MRVLIRTLPALVLLLVLTAADAGAQTPQAQTRQPLLLAGKTALFQRVLVHPDAEMRVEPGKDGKVSMARVPAFSVFYVYDRRTVDGGAWVEVGAAGNGRSDGWIEAARLTDWKQSLVLTFTPRTGRAPVPFLRAREDVTRLITQQPSPAAVQKLIDDFQAIRDGKRAAPANFPVVALEPTDTAVAQDRFYVLPILDSTEAENAAGLPAQVLQVASIDPGNAAPPAPAAAAKPDGRQLKTAMVFVVDTTVSMERYVERAREVVRGLYRSIEQAGLSDKVSFGLVAYRSSLDRTPGLEYRTKVIATLADGQDPKRFLDLMGQVHEAKVSSHAFNEDAFAGIATALDTMNWEGYGARVVFLITDAGALRKNDPAGATQMNENEIRAAADGKHVNLFVLHLRTPEGVKNHEAAEQQYRALTARPEPRLGDLYVPIEAGNVDAFGRSLDQLASRFTDTVRRVASGQPLVPPPPAPPGSEPKPLTAADKADILGYAMQMDFLGQVAATRAPQMVTAWAADVDLKDQTAPAFQVGVLLTKLQLNDLQQNLKVILDAARKSRRSPKDFFQEVATAAAHMSRDPRNLGSKKFANLHDSGLLGEFLKDLPYKSKVLGMTQDLWLSWSVSEQQDFIDELDSKINLYATFHNDVKNWVTFGSAQPADALYRVPLSTLP